MFSKECRLLLKSLTLPSISTVIVSTPLWGRVADLQCSTLGIVFLSPKITTTRGNCNIDNSTSTQAGKGRDMGTKKNEKSDPPQVVTLDKAFKLAERWVNNMTRVADEESEKTEPEPESRPLRLGLGATVSRQFKPGPSADPIEKKLFYNLQAKKRREAQENEENATANGDSDSDSEDDTGSRTAAFGKKRMPPPAISLPKYKKRK